MKRSIAPIAIAMLLSACGADPDSQAPEAPAQAAPTEGQADPDPGAQAPAPADTDSADGTEERLFVSAQADLDPCNADTTGRIVYATQERQFYLCEPTGNWAAIDLTGKTGETGAPGQAGTQGATGAQGPAGNQGADGQPASDSMWWDPIASQWWTFTSVAYTFTLASQVCTNGWRLPTATEFILANARGLRAIANSGMEGWLQDGTHLRFDGQTVGSTAAPYCLEAAP